MDTRNDPLFYPGNIDDKEKKVMTDQTQPEGIIARDSGGGDFENPVAGSYIARCYKMIDVGTQPQTFQGKPSDPKRKLFVWFELLEDEEGNSYRMSDGKAFSVLNRYTLSTNAKATLRKHIDAWRGKPLTKDEAEAFNVVVLLDKYCRLQISLDDKNDRTYVNVVSVGVTKKRPEAVNATSWWSVENPDMEAFEAFPDWLKTMIEGSAEWKAKSAAKTAPAAPTDVDGTITDDGKLVTNDGKDVVIEELDDDEPLNLEDLQF